MNQPEDKAREPWLDTYNRLRKRVDASQFSQLEAYNQGVWETLKALHSAQRPSRPTPTEAERIALNGWADSVGRGGTGIPAQSSSIAPTPHCWLDEQRGIVHFSEHRAGMMAGFGDNLLPLYKAPLAVSARQRMLEQGDSYCPSCGHDRDSSSVSAIIRRDGTLQCQMCNATWAEFDGVATDETASKA